MRGIDDIVVWGPRGARRATSWPAFAAAAERVASLLAQRGLDGGEVLVVAGATNYETLLVLFGAWGCGAAVSVVPAGSGRNSAVVAADIAQRCRAAGSSMAYAEAATWDALDGDPALGRIDERIDEHAVVAVTPAGAERSAGDAARRLVERLWSGIPGDAPAVLQATSGSTGTPRIVPVTWDMLRVNMSASAARLGVDDRDSFVSWMPLYHDMGLLGYVVLPALLQARLALVPPETFAISPRAFVQALDQRRSTISGGPTSGLALLERAMQRGDAADLSRLRRLVCGAEMIDVGVCERLLATGRRHGLPPDALTFAYGLAEATVAVSLRPGTVPAEAEDTGEVASAAGDDGPGDPTTWRRRGARGLARTGAPVDGVELRVAGPDRAPCAERVVGEIEVRGPSVMRAYLGRTAEESGLAGGWLRTGDLGFVTGGEVVIVGRQRDIVVVGGRNILPEDVERVVGAMPGIRSGRVVAVPIRGRAGEALAVVAERQDESVDERAVRVAVRRELGVTPEVVTFVPRGSVPKTSSGKLRRAACHDLVAGGTEETREAHI